MATSIAGTLLTDFSFHTWASPTPKISFSSRWLTSMPHRQRGGGLPGTALPVDLGQFLDPHQAIAAAVKDLGLLPPGSGIASANLFRGELGHAIEPAALSGRPLTQDNVFAAARHHAHVLRLPIFPQNGAVTEGAIGHLKHTLGVVAGLVEALAQFLGQEHELHREVLLLLQAPILRPIRLPGLLPGLLNHRGHLKAHRNGARRTFPVLAIEWEHQAGLEKAVSPAQVGWEGGSQRVPMPLGLGHALAVAPDPGVIGADDDVLELLLLDGLLQNGMEQGARFPGRAREDFVVGRPVLLRVAVKTDGAGDGAPAHAAQNAKGQRDGPLEAALLREHKAPAGGCSQEISQ